MATTLLSIDGIDFSDYATRGITMTLEPIADGSVRRDVNGQAVDMTSELHRKYKVSISCKDHEAPELTDVWPGSTVVDVVCIPQLGVGNTTDETLSMTMMVTGYQTTREEWLADTAWQIDLVEV